MSSSPGDMALRRSSPVVRRAIDLSYENKVRASSLKWMLFNGVIFLLFAYDLSCKCPGYTSFLHYVEAVAAVALGAAILQHALRLLPARRDPLPLTRTQQRLLGLTDTSCLDSSFRLIEDNAIDTNTPQAATQEDHLSLSQLSLSLSLGRSARASPPRSPRPSPPPHDYSPRDDQFIADKDSLAHYLKQYEERSLRSSGDLDQSNGMMSSGSGACVPGAWSVATPPALSRQYRIATIDEGSAEEAGGGCGGAGGEHPALWWRLQLDPHCLTQYNYNLRTWLHASIISRVAAAIADASAAAERRGGGGLLATPASRALLPFLPDHQHTHYWLRRVPQLARGAALSQYKWDGGGSDWDHTKPTDAELVLHLFARYLDASLPGGCGGACWPCGAGCARCTQFTSKHLAPAAAAAPGGSPPAQLAIQLVQKRPPHYVILHNDHTIDVGRGRNNLLHTLLVFLTLCAGPAGPSPLRRLQLGPAGLNVLWVIGR